MNTRVIIAFLAVMVLSSSSVLAQATTVVYGKVLLPDSTGVGDGLEVVVSCDNGVVSTKYPITDSNSEYKAEFDDEDCWVGDYVWAEVGSESVGATVEDGQTVLGSLTMRLNLQIPEFSAIAAGVALIGASAGYIAVRRKK